MERDRVERLLALLLVQNMKASPASEKMLYLNIAGFSNVEIADILQVPPLGIAQRIYDARQGMKKKKAKKSTKGKKS